MAKNDVPYDVLKDLLEAHLRPIRDDLHEIKSVAQEGVRANNRLDKHESRLFGWIVGAAGVGSAGGYGITQLFKKVPWS
jgi:hypothetical protein